MKMKRLFATVLAFGLSGVAGQVYAADYNIDKKGQHAFVTFKVSHLGYSYIMGRFNNFDGSFKFDANNPSASNTGVTINVDSIDTNHAERDKHLRSADFFNADKYPVITFNSTSYEAGSGGNAVLKGELSIRDVTRPVSIDVKHIGEGKDPWGGYRSGFEGSVAVSSSDYGLPDWVGNIDIYLSIEGVRQ